MIYVTKSAKIQHFAIVSMHMQNFTALNIGNINAQTTIAHWQ